MITYLAFCFVRGIFIEALILLIVSYGNKFPRYVAVLPVNFKAITTSD